MLTYKLLKNHAGLLLMGDYQTFRALHDIIHSINDRSPIIKNKEGSFLGLAYDVRKAYEGQRRNIKSPEDYPEIGPRFGVEILWPVILWQSRMLRTSLAFIDTNKHAQANAYALEATIEEALRDDFGADIGTQIIAEWERVDPADQNSEQILLGRGGLFSAWTKAQRKNGLVGLLASFSPMYSAFYPVWLRNGVEGLVSPEEYKNWDGAEWPDPKW